MANKDKNDRKIARKLDKLDYEFTWEEYTSNSEIKEVLSIASKNGEGNVGKPDHIYVNEHKKLLILIEDKSTIGEHTSDAYKEKYVEECIIKAKTNSQLKKKASKVKVFNTDIKYNPSKYAVDGITWYMSFFKQNNLCTDKLKNYFIDWRIVGIAVSGDIEDIYNHRISTFILLQDKIKEESFDTLENESDYINLCNNIVEEDLIQNIASSSKKINKQLRHVDSQKRPILLSALMICLFEYDNKEIDNSFITQYKSWQPKTIAESIQTRVDNILKSEGIPEEKRGVIKAELEFIKCDKDLTSTKLLSDILDELRTNVISKFKIVSNYDIIGKFYEEFLRFAGVANVKKGIVLTPHHITTLFTELIPVEADDIFMDSCCGTGAFLIAGMNKLLSIHQEIQKKKTETLLNAIESYKNITILDALTVINNVNNFFESDDKDYSKLQYTDAEKNSIAEKIAQLNIISDDNVRKLIIQERKLQAESVYNSVKSNQLIGIEMNPTMYSLAISNMIFRGDGKSQIYYENYFDEKVDEELKKLEESNIKPTIGLINPPYGGKDSKDNPTKREIQFLERILGHVSKYVVIIAPLSTFFTQNNIRNKILEHHTLKYVINMPQDLFQPNASTNTAIAVFKVNEPHKNKEVIFYDLKDDGYVLSKSKGRTNAYGKWGKKKEDLLDALFNPSESKYLEDLEKKTYFLKTKISKNDEWVIQEYAKTDYSRLTSKSFIEVIKNYIVYKTKKEFDLINKSINEISMAEILANYNQINFSDIQDITESIDIKNWQEISVLDLFTQPIESCKCSVAGDLLEGNDVYYIGAKKKDGGLIKKVAYDERLITKGNCIAFICDGDGSIGYHNYIDLEEFIGTTNLAVGYNDEIDVYVGLFLVTVLDLERDKYSFGRKYKKRIAKTNVLLPVILDDDGLPVKENGKFIPDWNYMRQYIKSLPYANLID